MDRVALGHGADPDEILAKLPFLDPSGGAPRIHVFERERGAGVFVPFDVTVRNGRRHARASSLDHEGFVFIKHATKVTDFYDETQIKEVYYPEVAALVKELTGAASVVVYGHLIRGSVGGRRGNVDVEMPSDFMHNDFTPRSVPGMLRDVVGGDVAEEMLKHRLIQVNLWRPIRGPLRTKPLAVCDGRSIKPDCYVIAPYVRRGYESEFYVLSYDAGQRWYYLPDMQPDEVIVVKNYDSDPAVTTRSGHGAIDDSNTPADALARESIEIRAFAAL